MWGVIGFSVTGRSYRLLWRTTAVRRGKGERKDGNSCELPIYAKDGFSPGSVALKHARRVGFLRPSLPLLIRSSSSRSRWHRRSGRG